MWYDPFISLDDGKKGNLFPVGGALLAMLSLLLPWYYGISALSRRAVFGAELLLAALYGTLHPPLLSAAAVFSVLAVTLYGLTARTMRRPALLAIPCLALVAAASIFSPARPGGIGPGVLAAFAGLAMMTLSLRTERA